MCDTKTDKQTGAAVASGTAKVRLADKPRKCTNCQRIISDEVEYGGKDPLEGGILCCNCFDFAKGKEVKP